MTKPIEDDDDFSVNEAPSTPAQGSADESGVHTPASAPKGKKEKSAAQIEREKEEAERVKLNALVAQYHESNFAAVVAHAGDMQLDALCRQFPIVAALREKCIALEKELAAKKK